MYKVSKPKGDGHCFLHSLISSLKSQHRIYINYNSLKNYIIDECGKSIGKYLDLFPKGSVEIFTHQMNEYVWHKKYNSLFGDILPFIAADIIGMPIVIISHNGEIYTHQIIYKYNNSEHSIDHLPDVSTIILKQGDHYDGLQFVQNIAYNENNHVNFPSTTIAVDKYNDGRSKGPISGDTNLNDIKVCSWNINGLDNHKLSNCVLGDF